MSRALTWGKQSTVDVGVERHSHRLDLDQRGWQGPSLCPHDGTLFPVDSEDGTFQKAVRRYSQVHVEVATF